MSASTARAGPRMFIKPAFHMRNCSNHIAAIPAWMVVIVFCLEYMSFSRWNTAIFFLNYAMLLLAPLTFVRGKIWEGSRRS
ncbi:uncharacterized protein BO96DRAFT_492713 [Aspergillus niger CBS 101883]|uniref:uncharacterized protein n=1 Tax=Aspergillus lacticoffeatus (strain CBS 101883) TaxID=1450533 RepID=UPI000D7EDE15|nr:uncharacterized protein BO96DRAFT_492713 [Aspergillus niger CBS 101883]PYH50199.1 hypothetical protein BO96DRAFT_492713 [Aspergillus niger CBS 101883]